MTDTTTHVTVPLLIAVGDQYAPTNDTLWLPAVLAAESLFFSKLPHHLPKHGCWLWQGRVDDRGWGRFDVERKNRDAHRVSWMLANRMPLPAGYELDHTCAHDHADNPAASRRQRRCVNPAHLELVTRAEHNRRTAADRKARNAAKRRLAAQVAARRAATPVAVPYEVADAAHTPAASLYDLLAHIRNDDTPAAHDRGAY